MKNFRSIHARLMMLLLATGLGLGVYGARLTRVAAASTLHVTNTNDGGAGSLRKAIADAASGDTIDFQLSGCPCTITLTSGELAINKNLTIQGPGANLLTISGNNAGRAFSIGNGTPDGPFVTLSGLTIANGKVTGGANSNNNGGGISNNFGILTITDCTITGNSVNGGVNSYNYGGGIFNTGYLAVTNSTVSDNSINGTAGYNYGGGIYNYLGTAVVTNSTLARNSANDVTGEVVGGGICNACLFREGVTVRDGTGALEIANSTLSGNLLTGGGRLGAGVYNADTATVTNCTIADNTGAYGSGIYNFSSGVVQSRNTIVARNVGQEFGGVSATDLSGAFQSQGHNLIGKGDGSTGFTNGTNGDQVGTVAAPLDPKLGLLADNGGPTQTQVPQSDSPAINAGDNCVLTANGCGNNNPALLTDQRGTGFNRKVGGAVDIGAVEVQAPCAANPTVISNADGGAGSLRQAILDACPGGTITFANNVTGTITLTSGELVIDKSLTITGPGANLLTISGNQLSRVFNISSGATATLDRLTIANGKAFGPGGCGGGIYNFGSLLLRNSVLSGNSTEAGNGAGIYSDHGSVTIVSSTIAGNPAALSQGNLVNFGGGIFSSYGNLTVVGSTFAGNSALSSGGAIFSNRGSVTLTNSTISGNQSFVYGAVVNDLGTASVRNTIIAGNSAQDTFGLFTSLGYNLIGENSTVNGFTDGVNHDQVGTASAPLDPKLGPLGSNGGPTPTMALLPGSPAIDAGDNCVTQNPGCLAAPLAADQRGAGFSRKIGSAVDIGAFEANYALAATGGTPQSALLNTAFPMPLMAALTESGLPMAVAGIPISFAAPGSGPSATFPNGNTAVTDNAGRASVNAIANAVAGAYQVTAGAPGLAAVTFNLINACPTITLAPLPQAPAGTPISTLLQASPAGNYLFSSNTLPAWLTLGSNGSLSGAPPAPGTFNFTVSVSGFGGACQQIVPVSLTVTCPAVTLTPAALPTAQGGAPYGQQLAAAPPSGNDVFGLASGVLPVGLTLSAGGLLSGTPTQPGVFNFRVSVASFNGQCGGFRDYQLVVSGCAPVTVSPATLANGTVGASYNQTFGATPAGSYNFMVTGGALPPGLTLNAATGQLTGTPTQSGTFAFRLAATAGACGGARDYSLTIGCPAVTLGALPGATAGSAYSQAVSVTPGGSYTFGVTAGSLPPGLSLNPATGVLSGLPAAVGTYNFTIKAQAGGGCAGQQAYSLVVACPGIILSPLATPSLNTVYAQTVTATPAGGSYSFAVTAGALPAGLTLNPATGVIGGTPTAAGAYNFTLTATGFGACSGSRAYSGTIAGGACPTITLADLPGGQPGQLYNSAVTASPGGSYSYAVTEGSLPPGLTLFGSFGLLYGYPTQAGSYGFTLTATDANHCAGGRQYNLTIGGAALRAHVFGDFDGDGKADPALWRGGSGLWLTLNSKGGTLSTDVWGSSVAPYNDLAVSGDYDGDGRTDLAVFRRGSPDGQTKQAAQWRIKGSRDGAITSKEWGLGTDIPVPADYDGDGRTDLAVWRGAEGNWYVLRSSDGRTQTAYWGFGTAPYYDVPVPADYDGDGRTDVAVFRRATGHWYVKRSSDGSVVDKLWGVDSDIPVPADYDGDGKADIAVWRGADTYWYVTRSSDGASQVVSWGASSLGDVPAAGDYDGDGKADVAVWRAPTNTWYVKCSRDNSAMIRVQGRQGDIPVNGRSFDW